MNLKIRLMALLLVVMMLLTSCSLPLDQLIGYLPEGWIPTTTTTTTTPTAPECTEHVDADSDLLCDVCGADVPKPECTDHPDENKDFVCDNCGATLEPTINDIIAAWEREDHSMTRKEMLALYTLTQEEVDAAMANLDTMVEVSKTAETVDEIDVLYEQFETAFYHIAQQMTIASIVYYCNMSDEASSERHLNTQEMFYDLQDKYMQSCRTMYLESPHSAELFADWSEDEIRELLEYDPTIMEVKKEIEELQVQYDNLPEDVYFADASVELYKQIVIKNNELAKLNGYDNYYDYASVNVYGRDYTAEDLATFRQYIIEYVVPNFESVYKDFEAWRDLSTTRQNTFLDFVTGDFDASKKNYLLMYLYSLEGTMGENMLHVFDNKNCVFSNNSNSHPTAFQTYMYEDEKPFCLFGSNGQTANTMVHEIGHYYAAVTNNDINNYDLCETHSQGNEFLFINFCKDEMNKNIYSCVRAYNLVNAAFVMILATVVDEFEQKVYALDSETIAAMTSEDFDAIMTEVCEPYGGVDWVSNNISDPYDYWRQVAISNPVYYISYAVSAVAAVEIFALAETDTEAAFTAYRALVENVTEEDGFLNSLKKAGLYTPFEEDAFKQVSATMKKKVN